MVLLNPKAKENLEHRHKEFSSGKKEDFRKGNDENQTDKGRAEEMDINEVQKTTEEVSCNDMRMQGSVSNIIYRQKVNGTREETEPLPGGKSNCALEVGFVSLS